MTVQCAWCEVEVKDEEGHFAAPHPYEHLRDHGTICIYCYAHAIDRRVLVEDNGEARMLAGRACAHCGSEDGDVVRGVMMCGYRKHKVHTDDYIGCTVCAHWSKTYQRHEMLFALPRERGSPMLRRRKEVGL